MKPHPMPFLIWCILTFVDPCKKNSWGCQLLKNIHIVYHFKQKSKAFVMFQAYKALVEKQNDKIIKVLCNNNGGKYSSLAFKSFCIVQGILY
jgi:hypothetical protein